MVDLAFRASIQEHLRSLAQLDERVGPDELVCGWFDDLYAPAERECPAGYPRDAWERGQLEWRECFSEAERLVLSEFHEVFEHHLAALPRDWPGWLQHPGWLAVRDAARVAVARFGAAA